MQRGASGHGDFSVTESVKAFEVLSCFLCRYFSLISCWDLFGVVFWGFFSQVLVFCLMLKLLVTYNKSCWMQFLASDIRGSYADLHC